MHVGEGLGEGGDQLPQLIRAAMGGTRGHVDGRVVLGVKALRSIQAPQRT